MGGTQIAVYQSTFVGVDLGRLRIGAGSPSTYQQLGIPTPGYGGEPLSPSQAGEGGASIGNLSEVSGGYSTTIAGTPVEIAYPYS